MRFAIKKRNANDELFAELILYISARLASDPHFGDTKLNKTLFYSDFTAYERLGRPITSHRYIKEKYGPIAQVLLPVRRRMIEAGDCRIETRRIGNFKTTVTVPLREANMAVFSLEQRQIIDETIERMRPRTAAETRDLSHDFVGWKIADMKEALPYETVFLAERDMTPEEENWALEVERSFRTTA